MRNRAVLMVNGKTVYDSGFQNDLEIKYTESQDIADELRKFGKPDVLAGYTLVVEIDGDTTHQIEACPDHGMFTDFCHDCFPEG